MTSTSNTPAHRVQITRWGVSATLSTTSPVAEKVIRRAVPRRGRDYQPTTGRWVIFGSHVERLLVALRSAGVQVDEIEATR